jgi:hypothetical protein
VVSLLLLRQKLERTVEVVERKSVVEEWRDYVRQRIDSIARARQLVRLLGQTMPAKPMHEEKVMVLVRRGDKMYLRTPPRKPPTPPKKMTQELMKVLVAMAKEMTHEEVARLVGGKVVDVGEYLGDPTKRGKKAILVDGELLNKHMAILKIMKGSKFSIPKTFEERVVEAIVGQ